MKSNNITQVLQPSKVVCKSRVGCLWIPISSESLCHTVFEDCTRFSELDERLDVGGIKSIMYEKGRLRLKQGSTITLKNVAFPVGHGRMGSFLLCILYTLAVSPSLGGRRQHKRNNKNNGDFTPFF